MTTSEAGAPIFILAPLPRSGTNFLWDLLRLHQDCAAGRSPVWEDYLLRNADHLVRFSEAAQGSWDPVWGPTEHLRGPLLHELGTALVRFLTIDPSRRLVSKSPTLDNLELFFDLFPTAHLLLLVRDGRDVVDSGMRTFGWDLEDAAQAWAKATDRAMRFARRDDIPSHRLTIVRYEDLVTDPGAEMKRLLDRLDLDLDGYDFDGVDRIPVRGSSRHRGGRTTVHWEPVQPTAAFRPVRRWEAWDARAHAAFCAVAAQQLVDLGYEVEP